MAEKEKWDLSREEIAERLQKFSQDQKENDKKEPRRGGRSSTQGVKLLYIRDYLYAEATKEHPKNARHIKAFLATKNIPADEKTIYVPPVPIPGTGGFLLGLISRFQNKTDP